MTTEGRLGAAAANRVYEDIELQSSAEWVPEEGYVTLIVNLQGYKKENLRIQLTSTRNIRMLGERPVRPENNVWQRFRKEFPVPSNCDVNETFVSFDNVFLYVKIPKTIAPVIETAAANQDQKPAAPGTAPPPSTESTPELPPKPTSSSTTTYVPQIAAPDQEKALAAVTTDQPSNKVNNKSSTYEGAAAEGRTNGASKKKTSMEKEKSDVFSTNAQNVEEKSSPNTEEVNRGKRVDEEYNSTKEDAKTEDYCSTRRTPGRGYYRQFVDGLIMELKEPRKLVNLAVAFGLVLVFGLYVKYAVNSIEEFRQEL